MQHFESYKIKYEKFVINMIKEGYILRSKNILITDQSKEISYDKDSIIISPVKSEDEEILYFFPGNDNINKAINNEEDVSQISIYIEDTNGKEFDSKDIIEIGKSVIRSEQNNVYERIGYGNYRKIKGGLNLENGITLYNGEYIIEKLKIFNKVGLKNKIKEIGKFTIKITNIDIFSKTIKKI